MSIRWRPGCWIKNPEYRPGEYWSKQGRQKWVEFPTYQELKKQMKSMIEQNDGEDVHVSRSRRGEWGEWFEIWTLRHDKPVILKSGWQ